MIIPKQPEESVFGSVGQPLIFAPPASLNLSNLTATAYPINDALPGAPSLSAPASLGENRGALQADSPTLICSSLQRSPEPFRASAALPYSLSCRLFRYKTILLAALVLSWKGFGSSSGHYPIEQGLMQAGVEPAKTDDAQDKEPYPIEKGLMQAGVEPAKTDDAQDKEPYPIEKGLMQAGVEPAKADDAQDKEPYPIEKGLMQAGVEPAKTDDAQDKEPHPIEKGLANVASPPQEPLAEKNCGDWYAEFKIGYYEFQNGILRKIFNNGGVNFGGEVGYILPEWPLSFWINGFYLEKKGHAIENGPRVEIELGTIAIGAKVLYRPVEYFDLFAGIGPRIFIPKIKNDSPYVQKWDQRAQGGGAFLAGFSLHSLPQLPRVWIEAFFDYSLWGYDNHRNSISSLVYDVDFSFWNIGGAIGRQF